MALPPVEQALVFGTMGAARTTHDPAGGEIKTAYGFDRRLRIVSWDCDQGHSRWTFPNFVDYRARQ